MSNAFINCLQYIYIKMDQQVLATVNKKIQLMYELYKIKIHNKMFYNVNRDFICP